MKQCLRLLALICFVAASSAVSFGQVTSTSNLSGSVTDPNGAVVVGATVVVKNPGNGQEYTATTGDKGEFTIPALNAGMYTVRITAQGFKAAVVKDVEILVGTPAQ